MAPVINLAKKHQIEYVVHQSIHDVSATSHGSEAVVKLEVEASRVFKTLDEFLPLINIMVCF